MRICESESLRRQFGVETFLQGEEHVPIVSCAHPRTNHERDITRIQRFERHKRCRNSIYTEVDSDTGLQQLHLTVALPDGTTQSQFLYGEQAFRDALKKHFGLEL